MNSNYYLQIVVSPAPALSTGHNVASSWRAACHVLKMLYYLWSACSKFIENHCYAGINIERGCHCLLTIFERLAWGHNPKLSHMSWCPKNRPVNFLFEKLKISQIVYASMYVELFFRWKVPKYVRWNIYVAQKKNLWCKNDKRIFNKMRQEFRIEQYVFPA